MRRRDLFKAFGCAAMALVPAAALTKVVWFKYHSHDMWLHADIIHHNTDYYVDRIRYFQCRCSGSSFDSTYAVEDVYIDLLVDFFRELPNHELRLYMWDLMTQDVVARKNAVRFCHGVRWDMTDVAHGVDKRVWVHRPFTSAPEVCLEVSREKIG